MDENLEKTSEKSFQSTLIKGSIASSAVVNPEQQSDSAGTLPTDIVSSEALSEYKIQMEYHFKMYDHYKGLYQKPKSVATLK